MKEREVTLNNFDEWCHKAALEADGESSANMFEDAFVFMVKYMKENSTRFQDCDENGDDPEEIQTLSSLMQQFMFAWGMTVADVNHPGVYWSFLLNEEYPIPERAISRAIEELIVLGRNGKNPLVDDDVSNYKVAIKVAGGMLCALVAQKKLKLAN